MPISKWFGIILASSLLVACGGDDDDNTATSATETSQNSGTTTITSQNSATVASMALKRLFGTLSVGDAVSRVSTGTGQNLAGGVVINEGFNLRDYAERLGQKVETAGIPATSLATGAVISENNLPCDVSGTNDFAWDDQDNDQQMSGGDTITITAHNCVEDGETTNGQLSLTLIGEEPNQSMTFVFTDFTTIDFEGTSTLNGDMTMAVQENGPDSSVSMSSNSFSFSDSESAGTFDNFTMTITTEKIGAETLESLVMTADTVTIVEAGTSETLKDFSIKFTENLNTLVSTLAITGILDDAVLGTISLDTLQPFEELDSDNFPYTGILKITATDNSSVLLTVIDAVNVRLEVDENGDGAIDQTSETTWTSLDI